MPEIDPNELVNAVEAAAYLGMTPARIYALSKAGRLGQRIGSYWLYTRDELDAYRKQPKHKGGRPRKNVQPVKAPESA